MIDTIYSDPEYLQHYGVKGMKWGRRRYQNKDGTRTKLGKVHERAFKPGKDGKASQAEKAIRATGDIIESTKKILKKTSSTNRESTEHLSDQELRTRINRLKMEEEYSRLTEKSLSYGKQTALDILDVVGDAVAIGVSAAAIATSIYAIKQK